MGIGDPGWIKIRIRDEHPESPTLEYLLLDNKEADGHLQFSVYSGPEELLRQSGLV
jgi:hypothetical protein